MVEVQLTDRLRAVAQRKRWVIGLAVGSRALHAALVAADGSGLAARAEIFDYRASPLPRDIRQLLARVSRDPRASSAAALLLAAQLAEFQAAMLDEWAPSISPVWDRVSAVAVDDAGLWRRAGGFQLQIGTCDAARLADLSGMNVIDAFAARDLAQDGRGRPLSPIPHWLLLRDPQKTRVLVEWSKATRLTLLPPGRDAAGLARIKCHSLMPPKDSPDKDRAEAIGRWITTRFGQLPRGTELVLYSRTGPSLERAEQLTASVPDMPMHETARLGISPGSLKPAAAAVLGLLHLDQVPANIPAITLARTPRVLGRLTPGSLANWHRLVRELAAARPSVVALRSAV